MIVLPHCYRDTAIACGGLFCCSLRSVWWRVLYCEYLSCFVINDQHSPPHRAKRATIKKPAAGEIKHHNNFPTFQCPSISESLSKVFCWEKIYEKLSDFPVSLSYEYIFMFFDHSNFNTLIYAMNLVSFDSEFKSTQVSTLICQIRQVLQ